jgi:hypothetical protein
MFSRRRVIVSSPRKRFPLREVCGRWKSLGGSPDIRIYFHGERYRLEFSYDPAATFDRPLRRRRDDTSFYLFGRVEIAWDDERDVLLLSCYGEYVRAED